MNSTSKTPALTSTLTPALARAVLLVLALPASAITPMQEPEPYDLRFDAVAAFATAERLGIGPSPITEHDWYCTAVLISPDKIATHEHCLDYGLTATYAVRFRRKLDGTLGGMKAGVDSYHHAMIKGWYIPILPGMVIGQLDSPVTHIEPLRLTLQGANTGDAIVHAGWGKEGPEAGTGPKRWLNICSGMYLTGVQPHQVTFPSAWSGIPGACGPNSGDSGGPVLKEIDGVLRTIGIVTGAGGGVNLSWYGGDGFIRALAGE